MKTSILSLLILNIVYCANAQTPVIALKSLNQKVNKESLKTDETFGLPSKSIDTIKKIDNERLVEIGRLFDRTVDTFEIKEYWMLKYWKFNIDSVRKHHPGITFIGFDNQESSIRKKDKKKSQFTGFTFFNHPMTLFFVLFALIASFSLITRRFSVK